MHMEHPGLPLVLQRKKAPVILQPFSCPAPPLRFSRVRTI